MPKFYLILKHTFESVEDLKKFKKGEHVKNRSEDAPGNGSQGTNGNPDNHFPSVRIKMHELQKSETNPLVLYRVHSTNY